MKIILLRVCFLLAILSFQPIYTHAQTFQVHQQDIDGGYISKKVWLDDYLMPEVIISGLSYENAALPKNVKAADPSKPIVKLGMDRKRPFVVIHIPAYKADAGGAVNRVTDFTLTVNEQPHPKKPAGGAAKTTDVSTSVLATGTWYKISVTKTGFYKIDNNLIATLSPKPANASVSNMRVFGNGGNLLSENNAIPRASDLKENSLFITDNGAAAVFYAVGPTQWNANLLTQTFTHVKNIYSDTAYYFITFTQGSGTRVQNQGSAPSANNTVTSFNYYDVHDSDGINPIQLGKIWFGEGFYPQAGNTLQHFSFDIGTPVDSIFVSTSLGHTASSGGSTFRISVNNNIISSNAYHTTTGAEDVMAMMFPVCRGACNAQVANIGIEFVPSVADGIGYLDYVEINARRNLVMTGEQMGFRDMRSVGTGNVVNYQLQGADGNTRVWDITNPQVPVLMNGSLNGNVYSFTQDAQVLHEFVAMNTSGKFFTPKFVATVANQNLHAMPQSDCIIISYPGFVSAANDLAEYHRKHDNMRVAVATTEQIYNEFSSGSQDLSAIRDFARMFYKRAGIDATQMPKYMTLIGGGSYDYKNRVVNNNNFVPVYESSILYDGVINVLNNFCSDDFYGFLDDSEDIGNNAVINAMDIGVGRLPARNLADAQIAVAKIIGYTDPATLGPWRIAAATIADDSDDAGDHTLVAEHMAKAVIDSTFNLYNMDKVYINAIPKVSTPAGERCPNANAEINNDVFRGIFAMNYNGHGNTQVLGGERIVTQDDFNNWNNKNMLPFMVTATCDFGQFDHPQYVSAAEQMVLREGGGLIAILTTTQAVYSSYNETLNSQYLISQFLRNPDFSWNTFGEASRQAKNATYSKPGAHDPGETANFRKFGLLGDAALTPDFPQYSITIDGVTDNFTQQKADTIKALGAYEISGSVHDNTGALIGNFNGPVWVSFYDKPRTIKWITPKGSNRTFQLQDNIVYKGKGTVENGKFKLAFIAPKDINYYYGKGKISSYAHNGITDAAGADTTMRIGGYSDHPQISSTPPVVLPYINDSLFRNGGITGTNTSLFVSLYDSTGINVSGNNVGHDLVAVLDDEVETPFILNDYYETAPNTYKHGFVTYPINGLSNGKHRITVRAWDVNDNEGEGSVDFMVIDGKIVDIQNLANYPNPFSNVTHFVFEHNHPYEQLDIQIHIYNAAGALAKEIKQVFTPTGSRSNEITWDGSDNNGQLLPPGVYIYRLNISSEKGFRSSAYQKLVIVR
ncbi:MAG: hypothetical protein JWQ38_496 [Flavipsychrobacter sp.]|nr:hypothetical protein [Flavipsychrobacter sp.]